MQRQLSLVIPAFNEAKRLPESLLAVRRFCETLALPSEVLIIVEKSTDETLELAEQALAKQENFRVIGSPVHRGKGSAVRRGMLEATGDYIFYMDADLSVPLREIETFVAFFDDNPQFSVLVGNRQHASSQILKRQGLVRRSLGQLFNLGVRRLIGLELKDTQCGFKAFRREAALAIFSRQKLDGFAFDVEVLLLARKLGYCVADLPVQWINSPQSKVNVFIDSSRMLLDCIRVRRLVDRNFSPSKPLENC
jgi:dolichyl-phosphate beta-glucosyltransferase